MKCYWSWTGLLRAQTSTLLKQCPSKHYPLNNCQYFYVYSWLENSSKMKLEFSVAQMLFDFLVRENFCSLIIFCYLCINQNKMKCEKKFLSRLNLKNRKVVYNAFINVEEIILRVCVSIPQIKYNLNVANTSLYAFFLFFFFFNLITQNHM